MQERQIFNEGGWYDEEPVKQRQKRDSHAEASIMTAALALPSKWDNFKQIVCGFVVADDRHRNSTFVVCEKQGTAIHEGTMPPQGHFQSYQAASNSEQQLFAMILIHIKAIDPKAGW